MFENWNINFRKEKICLYLQTFAFILCFIFWRISLSYAALLNEQHQSCSSVMDLVIITEEILNGNFIFCAV